MGKSGKSKPRLSRKSRLNKKERACKRAMAKSGENESKEVVSVASSNVKMPPTTPNPTSNNSILANDQEPLSGDNMSYKDAASKVAHISTLEKPETTSFHIAKTILSKKDNENISDDITVTKGSSIMSTRMSLMVLVPKDKDIDEDEAPLESIRKMNAMFKSLSNKLPFIKLGPWLKDSPSKRELIAELPEDVDVAEKYVYDFNRFLSPGGRLYGRIQLFYDSDKVSLAQIENVTSTFKKPCLQFLQHAFSDATSPIQMDTLTG